MYMCILKIIFIIREYISSRGLYSGCSDAIVHTLRYTMTEFSRSSARDSISIIEMGERIQFTSVYRQDFLARSRH